MAASENPLSKREQEILTLVARGLTNQEIARDLVISPNTVKVHLRNIFGKLEVASRTEAIVKAAQSGWIEVVGLDEDEQVPASRSEVPAGPPLAPWQRVYFFAAALVVLLALLAPGFLDRLDASATRSDLSDSGVARLGTPAVEEMGRWTSLAPLPLARSRLAAVAVANLLYAIGGESPEGVVGNVHVYDPETNGWLPRQPLPEPVSNIQAAAIDGLIYVPGGTLATGEVSRSLAVYDPVNDMWTTHSSLPGPRAGYGLAVYAGSLYLFGGWDGAEYVDTVWAYDPDADAWRELAPLPRALGFSAASSLEDRIVIVGGYDGQDESGACNAYLPQSDRWEACAPLILPRSGHGLAVDGASLYAIGGGWQRPISFNERYDSLTNTWSSIPSPISGQWRTLGVTSLGSAIYAIGGWSGDYLDANQAFQGTFRAFLPLGARGQ